MPGMDGLKATQLLREREAGRRRVPIVAMTAHAMKGYRDRCLAAGMDGYLTKPIDGHELIAVVEGLAAKDARSRDKAAAAVSSRREAEPDATSPIFNLDVALKRCYNRADIVEEMIRFFFDDVDNILPQIRSALAAGDFREVGRLGHRMKGTAAHLGAAPAVEAALRVERFAFYDGEPSEAEEAVQTLISECDALKQALRTVSATKGPPDGSAGNCEGSLSPRDR